MKRLICAVCLAAVILPPEGGSYAVEAQAAQQEWNQWRGPARNGTVAASSTPKWPAPRCVVMRMRMGGLTRVARQGFP